MTVLVMLNNFLHDFSAAGWIFCTVLLWTMTRHKIPGGDGGIIIRRMLKRLILLMWLSLGGIGLFGLFRALAYKTYEWNAAAGSSQVTLLIVKHIILAGTLVLGFWAVAQAKKSLKETNDEKSK